MQNFDYVIRVSPGSVHIFRAQDLHKRGTVRLEYPISGGLKLAFLVDLNAFLVLLNWLGHVHFGYGLNALQGHVRQNVLLDKLEKLIILHLVHGLFATALVSGVVLTRGRIVHDTYAQYQILGVVVIEYAVQVFAKVGRDLLGDVLHGELFVCHAFSVQLDAEKPWREFGDIEVGHLVIDVNPLLVFGDDGELWIGVIVDGRVGSDLLIQGKNKNND